MPNNTLNLKQKDGGRRIKQADQSSVLAYQLYDEYFNTISDIDGLTATVKLYQEDTVRYQTEADVTDGRVGFKILEPIPVGVYIVEITVGGYVFPSDRATTLEVVEGATKYEPQDLVPVDYRALEDELDKLAKLIDQSQSDNSTAINLIKSRLASLSNYDDSSIRELIDEVKQSMPDPYDDSDLRAQIEILKGQEMHVRLLKLEHENTLIKDQVLSINQIEWIEPELLNGWRNSQVAVYSKLAFSKDKMGFVHFKGMHVEGGDAVTMMILPAGYRPAQYIRLPAAENGVTPVGVTISPGGAVEVRDSRGRPPRNVDFGGLSFFAEK